MLSAITKRADALYAMKWTAQKNIKGWKRKYSFEAGNTYHIPYGRPLNRGKYIGYGVSTAEFLAAAADPDSIFYRKRSGKYKPDGKLTRTSTFYAMDCSTFVSLCWALPVRKTTVQWHTLDAENMGLCTGGMLSALEPGDALNCCNGKQRHIVLVSRAGDNRIEITEMTPPQMKRTRYDLTEASQRNDFLKKYCGYTIYRYCSRDNVKPFE